MSLESDQVLAKDQEGFYTTRQLEEQHYFTVPFLFGGEMHLRTSSVSLAGRTVEEFRRASNNTSL